MKNVSKKRQSRLKQKHRAAIRRGRPLHKKILLHPLAAFLFLCCGVLLINWTMRVGAADYAVRAKVPAAPITQPAVISSPADGSHFKAKPITVSGTCTYQSYVKLFRNGIFSGVAICQPDGTFSLESDLEPGANKLQAHIFNITDDEGPLSDTVTVYYDPPAPVYTVTASGKPFLIESEYKYRGYLVGESVSWHLLISGGSAPYAFNVKWGDGSEANYVMAESDYLDVEHAYSQPGDFVIKVNGIDLKGTEAFLQLTATVLKDKNALVAAAPTTKPGSPLQIKKAALIWLWPTYAILLVMALSFWLGERQEYYSLTRKRRHQTR